LAMQWAGDLELMTGNQVGALHRFQKVAEAQPGNATALNNYAYLLADQGKNPAGALKVAQKALELSPSDPDFADTLGWILYQKGLYTQAIPYLKLAAGSDTNPTWKYHLAMAYAKAGDPKRAEEVLGAALRLNPNLPEAKVAQALVRMP